MSLQGQCFLSCRRDWRVGCHEAVEGKSLGKHDLLIRFLRGTRRLNPPRPHLIPTCDLSVVLLGLQRDPLEPLESVKLTALSLKTELPSIKRVGDLQVLIMANFDLPF